ncbi:hypothetical protein Cob_v009735 [Colletotrichum orbiculare MAFF 240422]|uniref:Uncharacterized protein n=1 Tax=Colletotrichum orbiculare (strain 104-T / ATCC 96160 / CBS 514.97 / LARS 414 / MAFF 240422) TaxID=1213857 RepID=A0A484FGZ0_COLOR|nr:hypothetical protein Cob_v009735 [Colletotrichum orbiculare MAFF 240422]
MTSMPPTDPMKLDTATNFGAPVSPAWRRSAVAWKRRTGPSVLTATCSRTLAAVVFLTVSPPTAMPALAMTVSRDVMPWSSLSLVTASAASVSTAESSLTRTSLEPSALGRLARLREVSWDGSRTAATTVVDGRDRYVSASPLPMPRLAPVMRMVVMVVVMI